MRVSADADPRGTRECACEHAISSRKALRGPLWRALGELHGIVRDDPTTWRLPRPSGFPKLVRSDPWFQALCSSTPGCDRIERFMARESQSPGVPVRAVELTGSPGDVTVMDLRTLHTLAPNTGATPRLALAQSIYRGSAPPPSSSEST